MKMNSIVFAQSFTPPLPPAKGYLLVVPAPHPTLHPPSVLAVAPRSPPVAFQDYRLGLLIAVTHIMDGNQGTGTGTGIGSAIENVRETGKERGRQLTVRGWEVEGNKEIARENKESGRGIERTESETEIEIVIDPLIKGIRSA
jgi:hypothetical protein